MDSSTSNSHSASAHTLALAFYETLVETLPVKTVSDRTCFRRVTSWLRARVQSGALPPEVFQEVLLYAREASLPGVRNPNACFMSILRKELGYGKQ
jgi:hypothetical protein